MTFTLGPFYTCFIVTLFLTGYLHIIMHRSSIFFERTIKFSLIGILIILIRMTIPLNFSFTYTIFSYQLLPRIIEFSTIPVFNSGMRVADFIFMTWLIIALILLIKLFAQYVQMHYYLSKFYIEDNAKYHHLFELLHNHYKKTIQIAIIPEPISPAITGFLKPILILPNIDFFSDKELEYICLHEIAHYKKHHLWFGLLMEIVCQIHWWNPFVQHLKKEFALFLELSNDFFLIQSAQKFDITNYADLIVKTAKKIQLSKHIEPSRLTNFAINNHSILTTRINLILNSRESVQRKKNSHSILCCCFVFIAVFLSVFFVPEASFRKLEKKETNAAVQITEDNAYILDNGNGYSIYVDEKHFADINSIPDELQSIPIYKKGEHIHEK